MLGGNTSEANIIVSRKHGHCFSFQAVRVCVCVVIQYKEKQLNPVNAGGKQMANMTEYYELI